MKKRWLVVMVMVMVGLIFAVLSQLKEPPSYAATLSDGTIVRLAKVGVGAMSYDSYPPLKAALAGYVPNRFQSRLGERTRFTFNTQSDELGLLFLFRTPADQPKRDVTQFLSRIEFVESTGFVFKVEVSGSSSSGSVMLINEGPFPRRDPMLHMRLYEKETDRLLFDLHVPNPGYKPKFDEWAPEPVPATQTVEPLTVTLKNGPANIPLEYVRDVDVEITSTDPRWTNTPPKRNFRVTDATGGKAYRLSGLSPFEPAWKLHLRFWRNESAEFSPDEVWRTKLIKLPAALTAERLKLGGVAGGVEISTQYVTSAGEVHDDGTDLTVTPGSGGNSSSNETRNGKPYTTVDSLLPFFQLSHSTLDEETELIIVVKDQDGRKLTNDRSGSTTHHTGGIASRRIQFQPTPETTEVQLEVIVNRGRTFEFLVAPRKPDAVKVSP
ncbi:MAG: hypothetical protein NTZ32_17375 [Planctomycetales bacterium]|nr:hypothetical protein [Planctomycetales bacterium]